MLITEALSARRSARNPSESPSFDVITRDQDPTTVSEFVPISVIFPSLAPPRKPHLDALQEAERIIVSKATPIVLERTAPVIVSTMANKSSVVGDSMVMGLATDDAEKNVFDYPEVNVVKKDNPDPKNIEVIELEESDLKTPEENDAEAAT